VAFGLDDTRKDFFELPHHGRAADDRRSRVPRYRDERVFVIPVGVITAIYLTEYASNTSIITRISARR